MRVRRTMLAAVFVLTAIAGFRPAVAELPGQSPPLKSDTMWQQTPWGYVQKGLAFPATNPLGEPWPTLMYTEGYGGAGRPNAYLRMDDGELMALRFEFGSGPNKDYLRLRASVRGTECSGGGYNLYDRRHAWDGHHIIEWTAAQPWSNGRVGLHGSSLSGQTAYWIATTQPPHLYAVSANLLHSDIYRDIFMVGGVQNYLFPTLWTYATGPHRLPTDAQENGTLENDEICQWNQTQRYNAGDPPQPENEPAWAAVRSVDDDWYHSHAALTYASTIKIPYYQQSNWQDEQVGPRGMILWNHIEPEKKVVIDRTGQAREIVPKKLVSSSGDHGWGQYHNRDLWSWMDIWLRDRADVAGVTDHMVETYFETRADDAGSPYTASKAGDAWPFADTRWAKSYLTENNAMSFTPNTKQTEETDTYFSGASRHGWFWYAANAGADVTTARGYPDAVHYLSEPVGPSGGMPLDSQGNFTIAGPIMMNLWATLGGTDVDFFASVSDVYPDGSVNLLQRGWLKASHKAVDPLRSYYGADGTTMAIPYMSHTNPQPLAPGELNEYQIEIFPLGHIFRPGHRILIQMHTPPMVDGLWGYTPTHHPPSLVTITHDAAHPSWIQWPVVEADVWTGAAPFPGCKVPGGFPCNPASRLNLE